MNLYDDVAEQAAKQLTNRYSTSFSKAIRLFPASLQSDIYNIYGMVRIADEIVDTYSGEEAAKILDEFETSLYDSLQRKYSVNIITHAFCLTAKRYNIDRELIAPFFKSMRIDSLNNYDSTMYKSYICGSAEVIGLMCLKVFVDGDEKRYSQLENGARALGSAFQKINFLRDIADDNLRLGRYYFPVGSYAAFDEKTKKLIVADIRHDLEVAAPTIKGLPVAASPAVKLATVYYTALLKKIENTSPAALKHKRIRVSDSRKLIIFVSLIMMFNLVKLVKKRKTKQ